MSDMEEFKQTFFTECSELLLDMEDRLMNLDVGVHNADQLNAIFRCAHSIKGGSGAFGMKTIMGFTHILEALLDSMREGKIMPSREAIDLLLKSADVVTKMLEGEKVGTPVAEDFGVELAQALLSFTNGQPVAIVSIPVAKVEEIVEVEEIDSVYEISFHPKRDIFITGNEPLLILRELSRLGNAEIEADIAEVPTLDELNPVECFIKWQIKLSGKFSEDYIWDAFEFVRDAADITVNNVTPEITTPPKAVVIEAAAPVAASAPIKAAAVAEEAAKTSATTSIRVDLEKVDRLVNMVGELVITEAMLKAQSRNLLSEEFSGLLRGIEELSHHTRELQEAVMAIRMQVSVIYLQVFIQLQ